MVYHTGTQAQNMALFGRHKLWKIKGGGILHLAQDVDVVVVYDAELRRHILRLIFGQVYTKIILLALPGHSGDQQSQLWSIRGATSSGCHAIS